jgi:prevent-host-death family protein
VNAVKFRQNLGEMLNQVQYRKDSVVVTKDGKPVAALVDAELFERIRRMRERFDRVSAEFAAGFEGRPEDEVLAEIEAAVEAERHGPEIEPLLRNEADQVMLGTLRAAHADYLITGDKDLLALAGRYSIVTPAAFWERHGI